MNVLKLHNRYCHIERPGYLTPSEPLDHTKSWQCDVCKKTEPAQYVNAVIRSIGEELVSLKNFVDPAMFNFLGFCRFYEPENALLAMRPSIQRKIYCIAVCSNFSLFVLPKRMEELKKMFPGQIRLEYH